MSFSFLYPSLRAGRYAQWPVQRSQATVMVGNDHKSCSGCKKVLPLDQFHPSNYSPSGFRPECKSCTRERNRSDRARRKLK